MGEPVFRIDAVRDQVMVLLRSRGVPMTAGAVSVALELPLYAVQAGLESGREGGLFDFTPLGYRLSGALPDGMQNGRLALVNAA